MIKKKFIISVAPMMNCTDRHARYFMRLLGANVQLYTEMITAQAILHGDSKRLLAFHPKENYLALQLGGCDPKLLAAAASQGEAWGYNEINLNVGCPSPKVCLGQFGASLMLDPDLVADCVAAMKAVVDIPVTVKCRIGVDEQDGFQSLYHFVEKVAKSGCQTFIIHARKAWLRGLSPKENRDIPPLQYERVWEIKQAFPHLTIILNGGIKTVADIKPHLHQVDGVMIGRAAYANPYFLADIQAQYFHSDDSISYPLGRFDVVANFIPYVAEQLSQGVRLPSLTRHILGLFQGQPGAAIWRRHLSQHAHKQGANQHLLTEALVLVQQKH